ncbi:hypothetical protein E0K93_12935 [Puniceibacterium sp. HSS470]|uniref:hypothetical protein n=1 Tax=Pseudooceanicola sediminis TaxID=2211117 RepID=UPI0011C409DF|nr:hypothetical protein [Pseudooceanicola sediminis]KAA2313556.1 hypothetical protein E0K93_12935 [Puniceibacterium sp. HSS470]
MTAQTETFKFTAYLGYDEEAEIWRLRSVDITQGGILHKLSYPELPPLQAVLVESISEDVLAQLAQMNRSGEMMSNSDYVLALPGVKFQKLRVHTNFSIARGVEASFWFGSFSGQPLLALRQYAESLVEPAVPSQVGNLAVQALDRVVLPALNVVAGVRSGLRRPQTVGAFEDHTGRLMQEADSLIMYAELVKQLIVSTETAEAGPATRCFDAPPLKRVGTAV